jgi:uncharacterized protein (TIGR01777 family)
VSPAELFPSVLWLLFIQGLLGGFDTLYHHEITVALPRRRSARIELTIHAVRSMLYGLVFFGIANIEFHGDWIWPIIVIAVIEIGLTLWDFVVEDNSRKLPATERVTHTILAINGGALFALYGWQLHDWHGHPTELLWRVHSWLSWALTALGAGVLLSGIRDMLAARALSHLCDEAPFTRSGRSLAILVTGATGFVGSALVRQLLRAGHSVTVLTRDPLRAAFQFEGKVRAFRDCEELHPDSVVDVVVHLAGAPVIGWPWTSKRQQVLRDSRLRIARSLLEWINRASHRPSAWIQASAIGFYGPRAPDEVLTEESAPGTGFMSELCQAIEVQSSQAAAVGLRTVNLRFGLVLGKGGALPPLALPFRIGFGGRMGSGSQVWSWIHLKDLLRAIDLAIHDETLSGPVDVTAPFPLPEAKFAQLLGQTLRRPVWFHLSQRLLELLLGEMADVFVTGQRVMPTKLIERGFRFEFPEAGTALQELLGENS